MADAFAGWLEHVLGQRGLIVCDASDPGTKPAVSQSFRAGAVDARAHARAASKAGAELKAHGYHAQVQAADESPALFRLDAERRPHSPAEWTTARRRGRATRPTRLAWKPPNIQPGSAPASSSRPIVQDALFPTICYVAGPSELGLSWAVARGLRSTSGVPMPLIHPRASATLIDSASSRFLSNTDFRSKRCSHRTKPASAKPLKRQIPRKWTRRSPPWAAPSYNQMQRVVRGADDARPDARRRGPEHGQQRCSTTWRTCTARPFTPRNGKNDTLRRQFLRTRALVFPNGHAQERTIGFVWFLNQCGPALVERLWDALPTEMGQHWVITI